MNSVLVILKNILELEEWTNWNQEFSQLTNRKQRGLQRNLINTVPLQTVLRIRILLATLIGSGSATLSPVYLISPICFHLNRVGNGNDDILSEEHFENSNTSRGSYLDLLLVIFV